MKKSEIKLPDFPKNIKVGSKVVFVDGSYAMEIKIDGNGEFTPFPTLGLSEDIWQVLAVNVQNLPTSLSPTEDVLAYANNCIVQNEKGDIAYCSRINICNIERIFL